MIKNNFINNISDYDRDLFKNKKIITILNN